MNEKQKETVNGVASKLATSCNEKAKASSGWKKWLWVVGAILAGAVAWFTQSCESVTPAQIEAVHALYHELSGEGCIFEVEKSK